MFALSIKIIKHNMKKMITSCVLWGLMIFNTQQAKAQTLFSNGSFEEWDTLPTFVNPKGWFSLNELTAFGFDPSLEITTDAHQGKFAVKLISVSGQFNDLSGVLATGPMLNAMGNPDFSGIKKHFTSKPTHLEFYYKAFPALGDTCAIMLVLTKWNQAPQKADTIGQAGLTFPDTVDSYTKAVIDVTYFLPMPPDSAFLIASSSLDRFNPIPGSTFYIDDIKLTETNTSTKEIRNERQSVSLYPNPAAEILHISGTNKIKDINVFNIQGQLKYQLGLNENETEINVADWPTGIYFMQVRIGNETEMHKFVKH